ncbi:Endothelin-converting enzyme 1 [Temnothorax longispinosus]|uniref:Endothelin-converting enzyme 1 n=1 Tax=Temnothorax longispinosus TaxID=300112 RepID=A0A4S2KW19_9HYME|nr:Endothelin-converting enzyme 1 [Temnothorax longispinosus]
MKSYRTLMRGTLTNETGQMVAAFEKLGQFYDTCRDFKKKPVNFTPVYELLNELGGYLLPKSPESTDITSLISALLKVNGAPLFDLYVDVDLYDRTKSSVYLDFPAKHQNYEFLAEDQVTALFKRVKETIAERILVKSWLDDETRTQALQKLNSLRGRFHVSPDFYNGTLLAHEMAEVVIDSDDFIATVLRRFRQMRSLQDPSPLRRNAIIRCHYPYSVHAYYESSTNTIGIPLAMMTSWAWSWDGGPAFAVHATLGSVIAHEILHAFDFHRRRLPMEPDRDVDELLRVTPNSWKRLETRIECVARLYARSFWRKVQSYGNDVAVQVHCVNTTIEAYVFSVESDYHSPHPERINSVMMNSQAFVEAFRCPLGTKMNPPNKCTVW